MKREEAKEKAVSRDCHCIEGKKRDNNYNECIDEIFDYFEGESTCRLCGVETQVIYNIKLKPVNVCDDCGVSIFLQQATWYTQQK